MGSKGAFLAEMQKIEKNWPNPQKWAIIWLPNDGGHRKRMLVS
jgi:hypothetical protein